MVIGDLIDPNMLPTELRLELSLTNEEPNELLLFKLDADLLVTRCDLCDLDDLFRAAMMCCFFACGVSVSMFSVERLLRFLAGCG